MNAIIALCNFCELHGPSVLFCTQTFHDEETQFSASDAKGKTNNLEKKPWYGPLHFSNKNDSEPDGTTVPQKSDNCEGCTSMNGKLKGFISNDHEAQVSYVSSQYPLNPDLFSMVRQACVRSLSCEVCPGREGPIYFGDNHRGHVLSHTFFLKDSQARGFQSWYSIIVLMADKMFLLNSWPFLIKNFQKLISGLQQKAMKVFSTEQSERNQRAVRLNSVTSMTLNTFRRQRGNVKARSVIDLTHDENVFIDLHLWFTWILKAGACRIIEKLVEGFPCEDAVIDMERQEETEDGFIKVHIKKCDADCGSLTNSELDDGQGTLNSGTCDSEHRSQEKPSDILNKYQVEKPDAVQTELPSNLKLSNGDLPTYKEIVHLNDDTKGNNINASEFELEFSSLRELYQVMGTEKFHCLAYHTVVGNQIIVKSKCLPLMKSLITCLKDLLPRGCCHPIYYSVTYEDSWKCNFLGIFPEVNIPDHVNSSELHIQINITKKQTDGQVNSVKDFDFVFHTTAQLPDKVPQILIEMERVIADESFSLAAMNSFIFMQKEIWMNKVKLLFGFSRGKQHSKEEVNMLLQVLGAKDHDKVVLKFWMTGLSTQYKTQILSLFVQNKSEALLSS